MHLGQRIDIGSRESYVGAIGYHITFACLSPTISVILAKTAFLPGHSSHMLFLGLTVSSVC